MIVQAIIQPGIISAPADISGTLQASADFTSTAAVQTLAVTPDAGVDGLGEVDITVAAIPYREEANAYGTTVIIG